MRIHHGARFGVSKFRVLFSVPRLNKMKLTNNPKPIFTMGVRIQGEEAACPIA